MADKSNKVEGSIPGAFYVDSNCIACGVCFGDAPDFFKLDDNGDFALVYKQPETEEEKADCEAVKDSCPVDSIGNDG